MNLIDTLVREAIARRFVGATVTIEHPTINGDGFTATAELSAGLMLHLYEYPAGDDEGDVLRFSWEVRLSPRPRFPDDRDGLTLGQDLNAPSIDAAREAAAALVRAEAAALSAILQPLRQRGFCAGVKKPAPIIVMTDTGPQAHRTERGPRRDGRWYWRPLSAWATREEAEAALAAPAEPVEPAEPAPVTP